MSLKTMFDRAKKWLRETTKSAVSLDEKPKNKVVRRLYVIETNVKDTARGVKAGSKKQYVEYVEGTLKSYRNVMTPSDFWWNVAMINQAKAE